MLRLIPALLLVAMAGPTAAQMAADIYRVRAGDCPSGGTVQTGFVADGFDGILTALHGVVGCGTISARSSGDAFTDLRIVRVDIARDIALLAPRDTNRSVFPFGYSPVADPLPSMFARVWGFPQGIALHEVSVSTPGLHHVRPLRELVPGTELAAMTDRASPALETEILSVNGPLQPGHSGAPVFTENGRIVGIANGGFGVGQYGIGWASLPTEMSLQDASTATAEISRLANLAASNGFATVDPDAIAANATVEQTPLLALLAPVLHRIWLQDDGRGAPMVARSVADTEADTLTWVITRDAEQVLGRNARGETAYRYFRRDPGRYLIWLEAFRAGRYVPVSNFAHFIISVDGEIANVSPVDPNGTYTEHFTLYSRYPEGMDFLTLFYRWDTGVATIGNALGTDMADLRLVVGGANGETGLVMAVPSPQFRADPAMWSGLENGYAYLARETPVGLVPVSNVVIAPMP